MKKALFVLMFIFYLPTLSFAMDGTELYFRGYIHLPLPGEKTTDLTPEFYNNLVEDINNDVLDNYQYCWGMKAKFISIKYQDVGQSNGYWEVYMTATIEGVDIYISKTGKTTEDAMRNGWKKLDEAKDALIKTKQ